MRSKPPSATFRRTVQKYMLMGKPFLTPKDFTYLLENYQNKYSLNNLPSRLAFLEERDKALFSFLVLSCCRINEVLRVKRSQIDRDSDEDFVLIHSFQVSKRKKNAKEFIATLPITKSRKSVLYPFTKAFLDHALKVGDGSIFNIRTGRARQIIYSFDPGLFPHFIRACSLTYFLNKLQNPFAVCRIFGVKKVETLSRYYTTTYKAYREELSL